MFRRIYLCEATYARGHFSFAFLYSLELFRPSFVYAFAPRLGGAQNERERRAVQ